MINGVVIVLMITRVHGTCYDANRNGFYGVDKQPGFIWKYWKGYHYSLPFTEMKIRHI